ncbi:hypothetical protein KCP78_14325 [Salmonella enterica subsp. enterica]|nr:hypothetical protein KCP78_14325 [Salmonella enterica subsp. enterica]
MLRIPGMYAQRGGRRRSPIFRTGGYGMNIEGGLSRLRGWPANVNAKPPGGAGGLHRAYGRVNRRPDRRSAIGRRLWSYL